MQGSYLALQTRGGPRRLLTYLSMLYDTTYTFNTPPPPFMAITREQIFAIADELDAAGSNPTLAAVRKALGGGSYTTISDVIRDWRLQKVAKERPQREPAPAALTERLTDLGLELWAQACDRAESRLAADRAALDTAREQLEAEKREAGELADQLTAEIDALHTALKATETAAAAAASERDALRVQIGATSERAATAEARATEIEKRADNLNAELARVNTQNAELVKALAAAATRPPVDPAATP